MKVTQDVVMAGALNDRLIAEFCAWKSWAPLVEGAVNLESQIQPNGVDLTVRNVYRVRGLGALDFDNISRHIPDQEELDWPGGGSPLFLAPGPYLVRYNETINLPQNLMALVFGRSSLMRCGVSFTGAVWDAGYSGRGQSLIVVHNPMGLELYPNAKIAQLVFFTLTAPSLRGYSGIYQGEGHER